MTATLPGQLASEIIRVTEIREHYRWIERDLEKTGSLVKVVMAPAIALASRALDAAVGAIGSGDALAQINALEALRGFKD